MFQMDTICKHRNLMCLHDTPSGCSLLMLWPRLDIGIDFNMAEASKFDLLRTWPKTVDVWAVASCAAFGMWYQKWVPYFEIKVQPLQDIINSHEWDTTITPELWSKDAKDARNFVIQAIVSDPCLAYWNSRYRFYIQTYFCSLGMAFF